MIIFRKKTKRKEIDQQLLTDIQKLKYEWETLDNIIEHSIEPSEEGLLDLSLAKAKYFYMLREARHRKLNALS
ncbi:YaaL family protein [Halobacillus shinanisalinarum]|uniref:YaaL family protein n=1 Tax=Halobacillus shinanisalinarum TaxID=2932258 RepID=A0ABY4H5D6_9BACI|nr:YaaL family protein [Halobacillus shinanisalinarum]UOQ95682.1 YaaL family protein [Halobacillus shinanisalinarum]